MTRLSLSSIVSPTFLRSSALVTVLSFVASIFSYVFNLAIVKLFPVAAYGEYAAVQSYVGLLSVPIIAFGSVVIRRVGREKKPERMALILELEKWIVRQLGRYFPGILVCIGVLWLATTRIGNLSHISVGYIIAAVFSMIFYSFYSSSLQSLQRFGHYGVLLVLSTLTKLIFGGIAASAFASLLSLYVAILATTGFSMAIGRRWTIIQQVHLKKPPSFFGIEQYLRSRKTIIPLLTTIGLIGLSTADVIVAKALLPSTQAGLYGTLSLISKIILYLTMPVSSVAFVFFTDKDQKSNQFRLLVGAVCVVAIVGIIAVLLCAIFPTLIISVIASSAYFEIASALWAGALFGTLYSMVYIFGNFLISKNHQVGVLSLAAMGVQVGLLLIFHDTFLSMMLVNAFACFLLLILYGMVIFASAQE